MTKYETKMIATFETKSKTSLKKIEEQNLGHLSKKNVINLSISLKTKFDDLETDLKNILSATESIIRPLRKRNVLSHDEIKFSRPLIIKRIRDTKRHFVQLYTLLSSFSLTDFGSIETLFRSCFETTISEAYNLLRRSVIPTTDIEAEYNKLSNAISVSIEDMESSYDLRRAA